MTVTAPRGFSANGLHCGIKPSGDPDFSLVATADGSPVTAAAVFTSNKVTAAPVQVSRAHLEATGGRAAAVVLNSGNANAATGGPGIETSEATCTAIAASLGCRPEEVLVCSTGLIGIPLPAAPMVAAAPALVGGRGSDDEAGGRAARAIMTTDTHPKECRFEGAGGAFSVGGMAKGAAMLAPNMATMLAVLTTDAAAEPGPLTEMLQRAVEETFNRLSVDGCTSTNDTVIVLASGAAGEVDAADLEAQLTNACDNLALQMAGDAEGATKTVRVTVDGARTDPDAVAAARKVADSLLCKCSWYGRDPYWGRVLSELGTAGVDMDPDLTSIAYGGIVVCRGGVPADHDEAALAEVMAARHVELRCDLGLGVGRGHILTNDLTHAYVDENMGTS